MKSTVIYHKADYDGLFCREIAKRFLPEAECIGWTHGDAKVPMPEAGTVYVMDLSPECLEGPELGRVVWIDHHKSSMEKWPKSIQGYRLDGVAACRLAWQWFRALTPTADRKTRCCGYHSPANLHYVIDWNPFNLAVQCHNCGAQVLPEMEAFVDRTVSEPEAVRLAGEYDIWDKRDHRTETWQYALRCSNQFDESLQSLLEPGVESLIEEMLKMGAAAQHYAQRTDASICKDLTWLMEWEGLKFLCVNHARFNSLLFAAKDIPKTGHDALLGFRFDGKKWMVSLYHAANRKDLDLSEIAKRHGGGGHRGACGFTCDKLPFSI